MIQALTAYTHEVDDVQLAVSELMGQLNLETALLSSSVGIVSCYAEYIDSGVVKALADRLPFDMVGTTTVANATLGEIGETMLTLTVLTSDDVTFVTGLTEPILEEAEGPLREGYEATAARLGKPAMMLSFAPLLLNVGGDFYIDTLDRVTGGVPNFGTLAVDHNEDYSQAQVIYNGVGYRNQYAMVLLYGEVSPTYYVGAISEEKVFSEKGAVTAAQGNQLQAVNGMSVIDYLLSIGLTKNEEGTITGINSFPIIVDYNDGTTPVARAMFALTPEGYAVCGGDIPVGATLAIGEFDPLEIRDTTQKTLRRALEREGKSVFLMYSCIGRYFSQGASQTVEAEIIRSEMQKSGIPYMFAYSGGELCPVYGREKGVSNRNHNNTFIICAL